MKAQYKEMFYDSSKKKDDFNIEEEVKVGGMFSSKAKEEIK